MIQDIKMVGVKLTNRCNLNCLMCGQRKNTEFIPSDICLEKIKDILSEIYQDHKNFEVFLWGGEPLLYSNLPELLEFLRNKHIKTTINTNGVNLGKYAKELCSNRVYRIIVSLDGVGELHNQIRGADVFNDIVAGIKEIKKEKNMFPFITTNTVIVKQNYDSLESMADYFTELGIDYMEWQLPTFYSDLEGLCYETWCFEKFGGKAISWRGYQGSYQNIDIDHMLPVLNAIKTKYPKTTRVVPELSEDEIIRYFGEHERVKDKICSIITTQLRIESNGDVVLCPDFPDTVVGNIYHRSVKEILENPVYGIFQNELQEHKGMPLCKKCVMLYEG